MHRVALVILDCVRSIIDPILNRLVALSFHSDVDTEFSSFPRSFSLSGLFIPSFPVMRKYTPW